MPEAFHNIGVVAGTVGTVFIGLAVLNMMSFIVSKPNMSTEIYDYLKMKSVSLKQ